MLRLVLGIVAFLGGLAVPCAAQVPLIQRTQPLAIPPDATTTLRLDGSALSDLREVWASFPTVTPIEVVPPTDPKAKPDPTRAALRIRPTADVVPGIYALRIAAAGGVSNLRLLLIDDLPTVAEVSTNAAPAKAQKLELPTAVDGACAAETVDHFTFRAEAGQRLSFEVVAKRIASPLDPLLRLIDAQGRVLAEADDDAVVGADARFVYRFEKAGDYRLELRDIRYAGSTNHIYRLRIGDFPLVSVPFPAAVAKGMKATLEMPALTPPGAASERPETQAVELPTTFGDAVLPLVAQYKKGQGSGFTAVLASDKPEQREAEPNDTVKQATPLTVGGAMNGRFAAPRDRDYYKLTGKKGDKLRIAGRTRSLGSPTDLYLQLFAGDGTKLIAETDDVGTDEGVLDVTLDASGEYLLAVEDLIGRGGPEFVYRLEVAPSKPGLTAAIDQEKFDVPYAGLAFTKVTVVRSGYDGEIKFRVEGAPGVEADGTVAAGKPDGTVLLSIPPDYATGSMLNIRLIGLGTDVDPTAVGSAAAQQKALGGTKLPPSLKETIVLGVAAPSEANFTLKSPQPAPTWNADGSQGELIVAVERKKGFAEVVKLQAYGLPTGYVSGTAAIAKDQTEGKLIIKGPAGVKPPSKAIWVVGISTVAKKPVQSSLTGLALVSGEPKAAVKAVAAKPAESANRKPTRVEP